jgi:hypothetical protein
MIAWANTKVVRRRPCGRDGTEIFDMMELCSAGALFRDGLSKDRPMRVKIFSHENIETLETRVNEFLATVGAANVKHVNTAQGETETIITVWHQESPSGKSVNGMSVEELKKFVAELVNEDHRHLPS